MNDYESTIIATMNLFLRRTIVLQQFLSSFSKFTTDCKQLDRLNIAE